MDPKSDYSGIVTPQYNPDGNVTQRVRADKRLLDYPAGAFAPIILQLDQAQPGREIGGGGDVLYLDRRSTGTIRFRPDMSWPIGFPLSANDGVKKFPYKQLILDWDAQPGLVAYLWQGYGVDLSLALNALTSINNTVSVAEVGALPGTEFTSASPLAANTPQNVVGAGSNVNGIRIRDGNFEGNNGGASFISASLLAKATAPANAGDGIRLAVVNFQAITPGGNSIPYSGRIVVPNRRIASGLRLDWIINTAEASGFRSTGYDLL